MASLVYLLCVYVIMCLKAMVADDPDIGPYLDNTESLKIKTSNDLVFNDNQAEQTKEVFLELFVTNLIIMIFGF